MIMRVQKLVYEAVADLRRRAEGAMAPPKGGKSN